MSCTDCDTNYPDDPPVIKNHQVVDTFEEVEDFRNAFVTVRNENATYHTDSAGNAICVSRNPLFIENFTPVVGAFKQLVVYDFPADKLYIFDQDGNYKTGNLT